MAILGPQQPTIQDVSGSLDELREVLAEFTTAMLVTHDTNGYPRARPMELLRNDGELWFATRDDAPKVEELERDAKVACVFFRERDRAWISVSGSVQMVRDPVQARALWTPAMSPWLSSPDDPRLLLLRLSPAHAEYFEPAAGPIGHALEVIKGALTRRAKETGPVKHVEARELYRLSEPLTGLDDLDEAPTRRSRPSRPSYA